MDAKLIPTRILRVLATLAEELESSKTNWAVTGSTSLAMQGVKLEPKDIDLLTDAAGAYRIASLFSEQIETPVSFKTSPTYESYFGRLEIEGVSVEIMGNLRVFRGGKWSTIMTPETRKLERVRVANHMVPVVSLESQRDSGYLEQRLQRTTLPDRVANLISKFHPRVITVPSIHFTNQQLSTRRQRFGSCELFTWVLAWRGDQLVIARKADEWGGGWTLLGGAVEPGEDVEAGAIREAREESGLDVRLRSLPTLIQTELLSPNDRMGYFLVLFQADVIGGVMDPLDKREIAEVRLFKTEELLQLVSEDKFPRVHPSIDNAILDFLGLRRASQQSG